MSVEPLTANGETLSVKVCVALLPTPLSAVKFSVYVPSSLTPGLPLSTPVAASNVTPTGSTSFTLSESVGVGGPMAVTLNVSKVPALKVVLVALVKAGGWPAVIELLVPEIEAAESVAVIVCVPPVFSVAVTVAIPPLNVAAVKLAPPRLSDRVTESLKPVTTLLNLSSAVMETLVVPPGRDVAGRSRHQQLAGRRRGDRHCVAGAGDRCRRIAGRNGLRGSRIERRRDRGLAAGERYVREARAAQAIRKRDRIAEAGDHIVELIFGRDRNARRAAGR